MYAAVAKVPRGRVVTYGQVAHRLGVPRGARAVGWALRVLPEGLEVPWHRVVGSGGRIAFRVGVGPLLQVRLLRAEGVRLVRGRVDLGRYQAVAAPWSPPERPSPRRGSRSRARGARERDER